MARVLVACEYSGIVRDAFIRAGHDAWSCDLLPSERPGPHFEGDVTDVLGGGIVSSYHANPFKWDLLIAHPPCLWLKNLPPLTPTDIVEGREARVHRMPPGPDRWKERSRTFEGIAQAMADQWGPLLSMPADLFAGAA